VLRGPLGLVGPIWGPLVGLLAGLALPSLVSWSARSLRGAHDVSPLLLAPMNEGGHS
jgi:hypothetical protein